MRRVLIVAGIQKDWCLVCPWELDVDCLSLLSSCLLLDFTFISIMNVTGVGCGTWGAGC
jgi:hypothetical protein